MKKKKWIIWLLVVIVILLSASLLYNRLGNAYAQEDSKKEDDIKEETTEAVKKNNKFKDITVYDENKNEVKLSDYAGKPLVVNFWASWCPPCKREMPLFQKASEEYGDDVTILMINEADGERETMDKAQTFWESNGYKMNILFDLDLDAVRTYYLFYLPKTLFIDKDGYIVEEHVGELTETGINSAIKKILN